MLLIVPFWSSRTRLTGLSKAPLRVLGQQEIEKSPLRPRVDFMASSTLITRQQVRRKGFPQLRSNLSAAYTFLFLFQRSSNQEEE